MNSPKIPTTLTPSSDLVTQLRRLRLLRTAESLDDLLARASRVNHCSGMSAAQALHRCGLTIASLALDSRARI
jgi:hypothetical protein